jgi:hypothetical protein
LAVRSTPPHQGLDPARSLSGAIDQRLIEHEQLVAFQGQRQRLFELFGATRKGRPFEAA